MLAEVTDFVVGPSDVGWRGDPSVMAIAITPSVDECVANTVRLLRESEMQTDRSLSPNLTQLSGIWLDLAVFLDERETLEAE